MIRKILLGMAITVAIPAVGQDLATMQAASNLGTVIASEEVCGLEYDQAAISRWIEENTDPADMSFAGTLQTMIAGAEYNMSGMGDSARTAHCASVTRTARHYGFIE